ncbi:MAG: hypothetical protein C0483_04670 [Pirellula sp.]|nr:hypothetical protein [Pirellula sp.]
MACAALVGPPGNNYGARHNKTADNSLFAMRRTVDQSDLDEPESYKTIVRNAERRWRDLSMHEEYFYNRAESIIDMLYATADMHSSARHLARWIRDDVIPIAEELQRGLRKSLPVKLRPYFDLGYAFDQGLRRPDAYAYVQQAVGRPIIGSHYGDVWWPYWGPLGPLEEKLTELVDQIPAADADESEEEEGELDLSVESAVDLPSEDYVAPYDVPPGALAPESCWFTTVREHCRKLDLKVGEKLTELRKVCRRALRGEIYREQWLLELGGFRRELVLEMQTAAMAGERPWASWERDYWLYENRKQGVPLQQLRQLLGAANKDHPDWGVIEPGQISGVSIRVAKYLGDNNMLKGRGRPMKKKTGK